MVMIKARTRIGMMIGIAFAISLVLVIQSMLALSFQARFANVAASDPIFNVICAQDLDQNTGSGGPQNPDHCKLSCCLPAQRADVQLDVPSVASVAVYILPVLQLAQATSYRQQPDLLQDDLFSSRQNRARAPPKYS
jgi:hypothetical protein